MAGERPRLALVDRALAEQPEAPGRADAVRAVLAKHAPTISRLVRADVTAELLRKVGAATLEEISSLPHLRASFEREEAKHVKAGYYKGAMHWGLVCLCVGVITGAAVTFGLASGYADIAFTHAQQATQQGALVGAAAANQDPDRRGRPIPHMENPSP